MTKKRKIVAIIAIIIVISVSFMCGQTFAKYLTKVKGEGGAEIASWSFKVNDKEEKIQQINLSSTINNKTIENNKIAPGTSGTFQIKIDATGAEVGIDYLIEFQNETQKPKNLKFIYDNKEYNSITELKEVLKGTINANEEEKVKIISIDWKWLYETGSTESEIKENDVIDTENAKIIDDYKFDTIVTGSQVMPEK